MSDINGVKVISLKKIPDERGSIYHMLRSSDPHFTKFWLFLQHLEHLQSVCNL